MKKTILIVMVVTSLQAITAQKMVYGVKGGANIAKILTNIDGPYNYKYKVGFQIGGFAKFRVLDKLYLQPEILYILQGTAYDLELLFFNSPQNPNDPLFRNSVENIKSNESNIILPIMMKYYFTKSFHIQFGPQFDYLFKIKGDVVELDGDEFVITGTNSRSLSEFNWGVDIGAGYDFNQKIGIELRYNYGFNRSGQNNVGYKYGSSVFQLNLEYRIN